MKKKIETSKKLAWFSGGCFIFALIFSVIIFIYSLTYDKECDFTLPITLLTITGASFATITSFYLNTRRYENAIKIQQSFLKTKYLMLKNISLLDDYRIQAELDSELAKIESNMENENNVANQEIIHNT